MSDHPLFSPPPPPPPPSAPRPFDAQPKPAPTGCSTPLLVGCGILAILLGIGAIVFVMKAKSLLAYTMTKLQEQVVAALPEEVTEAERERLEAAFAAAIARVRGGEMDPAQLQTMQSKLVAAAERAPRGALTAADVGSLTQALEAFAAGPAAAPEAPAETVPPGPTPAPGPEAAP